MGLRVKHRPSPKILEEGTTLGEETTDGREDNRRALLIVLRPTPLGRVREQLRGSPDQWISIGILNDAVLGPTPLGRVCEELRGSQDQWISRGILNDAVLGPTPLGQVCEVL